VKTDVPSWNISLNSDMFQTNAAEEIKHKRCFNNFFPESRAVNEVCGKIIQPDRPPMTIQYGAEKMRRHTHILYLIFTAFPRQQWLCERASMWRYTYNASLVRCIFFLCWWQGFADGKFATGFGCAYTGYLTFRITSIRNRRLVGG
jgi:hypothetical protein